MPAARPVTVVPLRTETVTSPRAVLVDGRESVESSGVGEGVTSETGTFGFGFSSPPPSRTTPMTTRQTVATPIPAYSRPRPRPASSATRAAEAGGRRLAAAVLRSGAAGWPGRRTDGG